VTHSTEDPERPPSRSEEHWNELVSAASDHVKERRAASAEFVYASPRSGRRGFLLLASVILLGVIGWDVYYYAFSGRPSPEFEAVALQASLFMAQQAVETTLEETGALPTSLEEAGADEEGLSYSPSDAGYTITARGAHNEFSYQSGGDLTAFEGAFQQLLAGEVTR
jgi:hypothetical protein